MNSYKCNFSFIFDYHKHSKHKELPFQLFPFIILNIMDVFVWLVLTTK